MFLGMAMFSCDEEDTDQGYIDSVTLNLSDKTFTVLDSNLPTTVDFAATTMDVSSVEVSVDGNSISEGTAVDNSYSFTMDRDELGLDASGDYQKIVFDLTVDGVDKEMYTYISMSSASSMATPIYMDVDDDGEDIEVADAIYELSSVEKNFTYEVSPKTATVETVTASVKVGEEGTYAELWSKTYDDSDLNIGITGADYTAGDTVYVELVASVGTYTDTVESSIVISEYVLGATVTDTLTVTNNGYDLIGDSLAVTTDPACMIEFTNDFANLYQGITALNSTGLVAISEGETNVPLLKAAYDAAMPVTVVENVAVGDMFIVKTVRDSKDYYGTLEVIEINTSRVEADDYIIFESVMEEYDLEN